LNNAPRLRLVIFGLKVKLSLTPSEPEDMTKGADPDVDKPDAPETKSVDWPKSGRAIKIR